MKKLLKITFTLLFITTILLGFAIPLNPVGNWYQQFMPNIGSRSIQDVFFTDSLTGWAVTNATNQGNDTLFVLKTTNSGDTWTIHYRKSQTGGGFPGYTRIYFLNQNTGFASSVTGFDKTTNGGTNWMPLLTGETIQDVSVLSTDTIWLASGNPLTGGVFRTTNGGGSWQPQLNIGSQNPEKIYMFNARIGFISKNMGSSGYVRKTTDGGATWSLIVTNDYYIKIYFADSLTGWKSSAFGFKKTTDGGISWVAKNLPSGGFIQTNPGLSFSNVNKDTLWSSGGYLLYPNNTIHGFLNRSTDGGETWYYQIPDTSLGYIGGFVTFVNKNHGWSINTNMGIHTTNGGDTGWIVGITQTSSFVPLEYKLYQNYPNPFNPTTNIKYQIANNNSNVSLEVFDVTGREITVLVNQSLKPGSYYVDWDATNYPSGVYFYKLSAGKFSETKKMMLVK